MGYSKFHKLADTIAASMTGNELRKAYLNFFQQHGHVIVPSASLVPENDPTTLFTGSGMQPMLPYLLGASHPAGKRIADSQRCFRSQDIEEVGDNRHTTFFEMLGNWSLGDYFKEAQLKWLFEFLVDEIGLDPQKLYVTVFKGASNFEIAEDSESVQIWQELFAKKGIDATVITNPEKEGLQNGRIFYYGQAKNWWSRSGDPDQMPPGEPGGPDSEVFYDFGADLKIHPYSQFADQPCHVNCDCGRFLEIANSVFMQYLKTKDGKFIELPQKNVDFGGGLERILAAKNHNPDVFQSDLFWPLVEKIADLSYRSYLANDIDTQSFRIIADHVRAAVMLMADGVIPTNKERGYFVRRLLRRAIRHGRILGIKESFLSLLVPSVATIYETAYPELNQQMSLISNWVIEEEEKFEQTLQRGRKEWAKRVTRGGQNTISAEDAFDMYQTHGTAVETTIAIADEYQLDLELEETRFIAAFEKLKAQHAMQSRKGSAKKFKGGLQDHERQSVKYHTATHLLHAALRKILGAEVQQKGSNITHERLRFDFSFNRALTADEKQAVITLINQWIAQNLPVYRQEMEKEQALQSGAVAFFAERYPDQVTVYTIGDQPDQGWISKEVCGGPHVSRTGEIGMLTIQKEQAVAAGTRRIYLQAKTD